MSTVGLTSAATHWTPNEIAYPGAVGEWWIADYGLRRGDAPTLVAGPFHTKEQCDEAIRTRRTGAKK